MNDELLRILNQEQVKFYLANGVKPKSIELGSKNKIVFLFSKSETYKLFGEWLKISQEQRKFREKYRKNFN